MIVRFILCVMCGAKSAGLNTQAPTGLPLINGTMVYQGATSSSERSRAPCRGDRSLGSAADRGPCHGRVFTSSLLVMLTS